jgi:uncharacterized protein (TIGR03066 family)
MKVRKLLMAVAAWVAGASATAEEPGKDDAKKIDAIKKALVGTWQSNDSAKEPVEFLADGTMRCAWSKRDGKWVIEDGTYTVTAEGLVKYTTTHGEAKLSGWYRYRDGVLTSPRGPAPLVTWGKVDEKKR